MGKESQVHDSPDPYASLERTPTCCAEIKKIDLVSLTCEPSLRVHMFGVSRWQAAVAKF